MRITRINRVMSGCPKGKASRGTAPDRCAPGWPAMVPPLPPALARPVRPNAGTCP